MAVFALTASRGICIRELQLNSQCRGKALALTYAIRFANAYANALPLRRAQFSNVLHGVALGVAVASSPPAGSAMGTPRVIGGGVGVGVAGLQPVTVKSVSTQTKSKTVYSLNGTRIITPIGSKIYNV